MNPLNSKPFGIHLVPKAVRGPKATTVLHLMRRERERADHVRFQRERARFFVAPSAKPQACYAKQAPRAQASVPAARGFKSGGGQDTKTTVRIYVYIYICFYVDMCLPL